MNEPLPEPLRIADHGLRAATDFPADVEIAIIAHDSRDALPATLQALAAAGCPPDRITVVDIASSDGTAEWLARERPRVRIRRLDRTPAPIPAGTSGSRKRRSRWSC